jgi:hypothetical protein
MAVVVWDPDTCDGIENMDCEEKPRGDGMEIAGLNEGA